METHPDLLAARHIRNPSTNKDEGLRLIWQGDQPAVLGEMGDWDRRDEMIRDGKTVREPGFELGVVGMGMGRGKMGGMGSERGETGGMVDVKHGGMGDPVAVAVAAATTRRARL